MIFYADLGYCSGTLGYPEEEDCALNGDHLGIVKYRSHDENNFRVVSAALGRMVKNIALAEE